jgi:uncharacterized protein (TIGR03643 family)
MKTALSGEQACFVVRLGWEERIGFVETLVIEIMRGELRPRSCRGWRKRVGGRATKRRASGFL